MVGVRVIYNGVASDLADDSVAGPVRGSSARLAPKGVSRRYLNADGSVNSASNPAVRGTVVALYATGGGLTNPVQPDGVPPTVAASLLLTSTVSVKQRGRGSHLRGNGAYLVGGTQVNFRVPNEPGVVSGYNSLHMDYRWPGIPIFPASSSSKTSGLNCWVRRGELRRCGSQEQDCRGAPRDGIKGNAAVEGGEPAMIVDCEAKQINVGYVFGSGPRRIILNRVLSRREVESGQNWCSGGVAQTVSGRCAICVGSRSEDGDKVMLLKMRIQPLIVIGHAAHPCFRFCPNQRWACSNGSSAPSSNIATRTFTSNRATLILRLASDWHEFHVGSGSTGLWRRRPRHRFAILGSRRWTSVRRSDGRAPR